MSGYDATILYTLARRLPHESNLLEVGSWIGRSSCVLAYGIRDAAPFRLKYEIVDYGIAGSDEWKMRFGKSLFSEANAKDLASVVMFPGGTVALLKQNLVDRDLSKYVSLIILGDIADYKVAKKYDAIFCDATHGEEEIRKNVPLLAKLLKGDFILVCDDIIKAEEAKLVHELVGSESYYLTCDSDTYSKMAIFARGAHRDMFG